MKRLQKVISHAGICSRRKAEILILEKRVKVNGKIVDILGTLVKKDDEILVDDKPILKEEKVYYILNKPKKYICSVSDDRGRKTVVDLIDTKYRIYPVGRLDYETTGLLLLTNDGNFSNEIIHPSFNIEKHYSVMIQGILSDDDIKLLKKGILIDDRLTTPAIVYDINRNVKNNICHFNIIITEGRNRIVRKMMEKLDHKILALQRFKLGNIDIKGLEVGKYRYLKPFELKSLRSLSKKAVIK